MAGYRKSFILTMSEIVSIGSIHYITMGKTNGITPKDGYPSRNKYFVILGQDKAGYLYGGVVINSRINQKLPVHIQMYHYPISKASYAFLSHDSFIDCSTLMSVPASQLSTNTLCGELTPEHLGYVLDAVRQSGTIPPIKLREYGIIP